MSLNTISTQAFDIPKLPLTGRHLIEASAGTGKTYSIMRIYLRLLLEKKLNVGDILVMTFTNAATAELKSRLATFLNEAQTQWRDSTDDVFVHLRGIISDEEALLRLKQAQLQLDEAAIYTIHGFCKRALSQQAFHSGVSFHADMDAETKAITLQAAQDWYRNQAQDERLEILLNNWATPQAFIDHWGHLIEQNDEIIAPEPMNDSLLGPFLEQWPTEREVFIAKCKSKTPSTQASMDRCLETLDAIAERGALVKGDLDVKSAFSSATKKNQMPRAYALVCELLKKAEVEKVTYALEGVNFIKARTHQEKDRLDQLDFNDLILRLAEAVRNPDNTELRARLLSEFPAALIDEFQDTDSDQYAIIDAIYQKTDESFLAMIGDPKQAIYAFRGGDVFAYLKAREQADACWSMNTNFRSSAKMVAGYNQAFLQSHAESDTNPDIFGFDIHYTEVEPSKNAPSPVFSDEHERSPMQWVMVNPSDGKAKVNKAFADHLAQWCVSETVKLLSDVTLDERPITPNDIAFLVRSAEQANQMQTLLSDAGIASSFKSKAPLFASTEAQQLRYLLTGIWRLDDERHLTTAMACQWLGFSTQAIEQIKTDEQQWSHWQNQFDVWRETWVNKGILSVLLNIIRHYLPNRGQHHQRVRTNCLHLAERLQQESSRYRTPEALLGWLEQQLKAPPSDKASQLRLDTDEQAVSIVTIHSAKGLEYPIVFLPFISYFAASPRKPAFIRYHERKTFEVKSTVLPSSIEAGLYKQEDNSESIRLFYVAMTRAALRTYGLLAPFSGFKDSLLGLTLGGEPWDGEAIHNALIGQSSASMLSMTESDITANSMASSQTMATPKPAEFKGKINRQWWLASFSSIKHDARYDHAAPDRDAQPVQTIEPDNLALRFSLKKGAEAGNLLHDILEVIDFNKPDYAAVFESAQKRYGALFDSFDHDTKALEGWLNKVLSAPLNTLPNRPLCLADLPRQQTLREAKFYFPMQGANMNEFAQLMSEHSERTITLPTHRALSGMMHGFIDLIFEHQGRYYVADYKSTHLGDQLSQYGDEALEADMHKNHYDIQYSLYALALHRYLHTQLSDYDPDQHFGGVYYLYLRGMSTTETHQAECLGVYQKTIPSAFLKKLDRLFKQTETQGSER